MGQAFAQVEDYLTCEGNNLADVLTLMTILKITFRDPDHIATAERKLNLLKQINKCDFSTYYVEFNYFAANVQWIDPAKWTVLMWGLENKIKDILTLSDNLLQQFQEFVTILK
jgi:hypothetical protein